MTDQRLGGAPGPEKMQHSGILDSNPYLALVHWDAEWLPDEGDGPVAQRGITDDIEALDDEELETLDTPSGGVRAAEPEVPIARRPTAVTQAPPIPERISRPSHTVKTNIGVKKVGISPPAIPPAAMTSGNHQAVPASAFATPAASQAAVPTQETPAPKPRPQRQGPDVGNLMAELSEPDPHDASKPRESGALWYSEIFTPTWKRLNPPNHAHRTQRETDYIEKSLALKKGSRVLDVGAGWGRHCIELSSRGYTASALDLSLPLLEKGQRMAHRRGVKIQFIHGDMRNIDFPEEFDAAICMQTTFGYFDDVTNLRVLESITKTLKPGGRVMLEFLNRDYIVPHTPRRTWWDKDELLVMEEVDFDHRSSRIEVVRTVVEGAKAPWEQHISIRLYCIHELQGMFAMCGLKVVEVTGDIAHPGVYLGACNRQLIIVGEKQ